MSNWEYWLYGIIAITGYVLVEAIRQGILLAHEQLKRENECDVIIIVDKNWVLKKKLFQKTITKHSSGFIL